jgi:RNase P subunit RPR2
MRHYPPVMVTTQCVKCSSIYEEMFIELDEKGKPSYVGLVCSNCGSKNTLHKKEDANE